MRSPDLAVRVLRVVGQTATAIALLKETGALNSRMDLRPDRRQHRSAPCEVCNRLQIKKFGSGLRSKPSYGSRLPRARLLRAAVLGGVATEKACRPSFQIGQIIENPAADLAVDAPPARNPELFHIGGAQSEKASSDLGRNKPQRRHGFARAAAPRSAST